MKSNNDQKGYPFANEPRDDVRCTGSTSRRGRLHRAVRVAESTHPI